jgi:hypothetical protein
MGSGLASRLALAIHRQLQKQWKGLMSIKQLQPANARSFSSGVSFIYLGKLVRGTELASGETLWNSLLDQSYVRKSRDSTSARSRQ